MPILKKYWISIVLSLAGFTLITLTVFADSLGLVHNTAWGGIRVLGLVIGILFVFCAAVFQVVPSKPGRVYILGALLAGSVLMVYVWFGTAGYWTRWPASTNYYDMQATAFQHGQIALLLKPDPALLAMPDPYDVPARKAQPGLAYVFDGSFYHGKFYLYWGPVPAVMLALVKYVAPLAIGDQYLVFAFVAGLFLIQVLLILWIWSRFFQHLPSWTVWMGILLVGLASPWTWLLNQPEIYEASIAAGQFFFLGGLFIALLALARPTLSPWRFAMAGILWGCAVGSQWILALPVLFMALMLFWWLTNPNRPQEEARTVQLALGSFVIPIVAVVLLLGWYNWVRFGSVFESGLRYQLSGINYRDHYDEIFLLGYVPANFRNYFIPGRT